MKSIKIGTRNSPLALWQAREVARNLQNKNLIYKTPDFKILKSGALFIKETKLQIQIQCCPEIF